MRSVLTINSGSSSLRFALFKVAMKAKTRAPDLLRKMDAWWRAANYLSVAQIYLYDNPLLKMPLKLADN